MTELKVSWRVFKSRLQACKGFYYNTTTEPEEWSQLLTLHKAAQVPSPLPQVSAPAQHTAPSRHSCRASLLHPPLHQHSWLA